MLDRKGTSAWALVAVAGAIGCTIGWAGSRASQPPQSEGLAVVATTEEGAAVTATIEQVRSRPEAFSGKRVRLTGQLDECYGWECSLCPESMSRADRNADRCLPLSFRPLINGTGFGSDEQEQVFRLSSVTLTAHFDPSCWNGGCLDRQTVLEDATVLSVIKRRAGASGLWIGETTKLFQIDEAAAKDFRATALRAGYPENPPIRAFRTGGPEPRFVVCWSSLAFGEQDPGAWPSTLESALYAQSTLDFFECNEVRKVGDQMVVQVRA